jgi:ribonuclease P protein component
LSGALPEKVQGFPKTLRVVNQRDFDRAFKSGKVISDGTLVVHVCRNELEQSRLGLSISRRVGNSPVRNLWKRLIREAFRKQRLQLPSGWDMVVRPKRGALPDYLSIDKSILKLGRRLGA